MKSNNENERNRQDSHPRNIQSRSGQEGSEQRHELEQEQQSQDNDETSYSEQTDVTPPAHHEFPSVGNAKTDFASRRQGRTTGRMLGHEPGTEGI